MEAINRIGGRFSLAIGHMILIIEAVRTYNGASAQIALLISAALMISIGLTGLIYGTAWDVARLTWEKRERKATSCPLSTAKSVAGKSASIN